LGRYSDAIDTCRAGLQRHPFYQSARVTLGRALIEIGEFESASIELEQVLRTAPENLAAIRALAEIHRRRGEMPESYDSYDLRAGDHPEPAAAAFPPIPVAVQSFPVTNVAGPVERPGLAGLESFLSAIQRARRDTLFTAAR
jgi:tetratricopeptide (TPR) repeat protein